MPETMTPLGIGVSQFLCSLYKRKAGKLQPRITRTSHTVERLHMFLSIARHFAQGTAHFLNSCRALIRTKQRMATKNSGQVRTERNKYYASIHKQALFPPLCRSNSNAPFINVRCSGRDGVHAVHMHDT